MSLYPWIPLVKLGKVKRQSVGEMLATKKLQIRNWRAAPEPDDVFKRTRMAMLERSVRMIHNCTPLQNSYEELYRTVEGLCTYNCKKYLYENLRAIIEDYLTSKIHVFYLEDVAFLDTLNRTWLTFCKQTKLIVNVFLYLDRSLIKDNYTKQSIWNMSLHLFRSNIVLNNNINSKLMDAMLTLIEVERQGETIDVNLLKSLVDMLHYLQLYEDMFEPQFLQTTNVKYEQESVKLIREFDLFGYLEYASRRLREEENRIRSYIRKSTERNLLNALKHQLIKAHLAEILAKGVEEFFENKRVAETALLYDLLGLVGEGHCELCKAFTSYLKDRGGNIMQEPDNDKNMIQDLLCFKERIDELVSMSFRGNEKFSEAVRSSFKYFLNQKQNKPAELLARFVDFKLRGKNEDENIEVILDKIMVLFRFVQGKDIFEAFYKRDLAKRLLVGKSASQDAENSMITKLKLECGASFTAKLEGMFKDIRLSQDINNSFRQHLEDNAGSNVTSELTINVLTSSFWPSYPTYLVNLPEEIIQYQSIFQNFYVLKYSGRRLQWQHSLGHCIVKADFLNGKKELQVSLFQTIVLLLFNASNRLNYNDIKDSCNLEDNELKRTLQSLACGKSKILVKSPKGREVEANDVFIINNKFCDKLFRVKVNQVQLKETVEERRATQEGVFQDRQFQIDAAIVRIMKQRKVLEHGVLMAELHNALDIPLTAGDIKKRIEQLIDRDYIERDNDNQTIYKYVA